MTAAARAAPRARRGLRITVTVTVTQARTYLQFDALQYWLQHKTLNVNEYVAVTKQAILIWYYCSIVVLLTRNIGTYFNVMPDMYNITFKIVQYLQQNITNFIKICTVIFQNCTIEFLIVQLQQYCTILYNLI